MHCIISYLAFSCFSQCCPVVGYSLEVEQNRQLNVLKYLRLCSLCEIAALAEQYELYYKKAEEFIFLFVAV